MQLLLTGCARSAIGHTKTQAGKGAAVKTSDLPGYFLRLISDSVHSQPTTAQHLLPLMRFLKLTLERAREHELIRAREARPAELVFRFVTPE